MELVGSCGVVEYAGQCWVRLRHADEVLLVLVVHAGGVGWKLWCGGMHEVEACRGGVRQE